MKLKYKKKKNKIKGQSNDKLWHLHRKFRITASKCHRIAALRSRPSTSPTKALREVLKYNKQYKSEEMKQGEMKQGLQKEHEIAKLYESTMTSLAHKGISVEKCGLNISQSHGFLAATPDAHVLDPSVSVPNGLLEMKYIQMNDTETLNQALLRKRICVKGNDKLTINNKHQYYYQIQQQMFVTKHNWTDFVVRSCPGNELYIVRYVFLLAIGKMYYPSLTHFLIATFCQKCHTLG
jgi:hypothetical protein